MRRREFVLFGGALCVVLSLSDFRLARSIVFIHWRGAAEVARRIRCAPWPAPVLSFFMIGSALAAASELRGRRRRDRLAPGW